MGRKMVRKYIEFLSLGAIGAFPAAGTVLDSLMTVMTPVDGL
jgi:hypothetical protein